jgi:hypothetical protein
LLCSHCNAAIGAMRENLGLLEAAKMYLLSHR